MTITLTLIGWSSIPLFLRYFAEEIDPWTANGWRYGISAIVWAPLLIVIALRNRMPRGLWRAAIIPSLINVGGQVCFTYAHYRIDPGLLTFGLRSQLLFVAIGAWILFPIERRIIKTGGYIGGAIILTIGTVAVLVFEPAATSEHPSHAVETTGAAWGSFGSYIAGVALALMSGVFFAAYGLSVRKYMHGIRPVIAFATICQYTAGVMLALMFAFGERAGLAALDMTPNEVALLILSALVGIAMGHVFYYISIARLGVAVSAGVLQLQPFFVAVGSLWLFDEILAPGQWAGGVIAVTGAFLMLWVQWRINQRDRAHALEEPLAIAEGESGR